MYFGDDRPNSKLIRERIYESADPNIVVFRIRGETVNATSELDISVPHEGNGTYPPCPDCGGEIEWTESGHSPGARKCSGCGSEFCDCVYGSDSPIPEDAKQ